MGEGRFIQIDGEPGCGKSALLKRFVEESAAIGPVFLLKDSRIHPRGWSNYASTIGISDDVATLLREFARAGEPILFIDGIDKISDPSAQLTVNDILRSIIAAPDLSGWRVLVTIREQNLRHLETWLDPDVLKALPIKTVSVGSLNDEELSFVAEAFPRLQPILGSDHGTDVILQRPFFLETILQLGEGGATSALPATEVELLGLWWRLGAGDQLAFAKAQRRRNALLQLAEKVVSAPGSAPSVRDVDEEALAELIESDVVRQHAYGHSVEFAHDIYEEWSLTQLLIGESDIVSFLQKNREPDNLIRPMQLLAAMHLETNATIERWEGLYDVTGSDTLRSVWRRAVITAPLHSVRATELLGRLSEFLQDGDAARLRRLILAVRTSEVVPNPLFLDETLTPHVDASDRAKFAMLLARPKLRTWLRFLNWFIPIAPSLSPTFIPEMVKIFQPWQSQFSGMNIRHCRAIGLLSYSWLKEIEEARHPARFEDYRKPFGVDIDDEDIEKNVRHLFLSSVGDIKIEAAEYLKTTSERDNTHIFRRDIVENCIECAKHIPAELVDFILASFLLHPRDRKKRHSFDSISDHEVRDLGLQDSSAFYPASPVRLPFLVLLRWHKPEGLRLVRSLCNFAMDVWRWSCSWRHHEAQPLTPVPISVEFAWGKQDFWGTQQTYMWFRGSWGNHACESALMALEQWALEELEKGADFNTIFKEAMSAVSGVAFVVAAHLPAEQMDDALLSWVLDVLQRAATGPEGDDTVGVRASLLLMHPAVFAAHGFSQLLARGLAEEVSVEALLNLAVDAMSGVQAAVFSGAKAYGARRPEVVWALMRLGLGLCIGREGDGPEPYSIAWDAREAELNLALVDEASRSIAEKRFDALPVPPEPWVKGVSASRRSARDTKGYVRNPVWFYHHDAEKTILQLPIEVFLSESRKSEFLRLVGQLVDAMVQEMHPPFAEHGRDRSERTPFEWIYGFSYWCGRVGAQLTVSEFREAVIDRAIGTDSETALMILQSALRSYMVFALLPEEPLADEKMQFWSEITEWMFALPEWRHQRRDHLDREFQATALSLLFCAQNDFAPLICGLETSWPHFSKFAPHFERVVREFGRHGNLYYAVLTFFKRGGFALLPDPGFVWLHDVVLLHKDDPEFWERNGEETVDLLKRVLAEKGERLSLDDRTRLIGMLDTLVDGGVRGAGFVQQELSRSP